MTPQTLPARLLAEADFTRQLFPVAIGPDLAHLKARESMLREAAAALSGREGRCKTVIVYGDRGPEEREPVEDYYTTPQPGGGWRPIAEAPKDGRYVLLVHETSGGRPYAGMWSYDDKQWADERGCIRVPTHWMPLPAAPSAKGVKNG